MDMLSRYENMPIQIYWKTYHLKMKFSAKKIWYFSSFCSKHIKNNVYPCKPMFYCIKMWLRGSKVYRYVFVIKFFKSFSPPSEKGLLWKERFWSQGEQSLSLPPSSPPSSLRLRWRTIFQVYQKKKKKKKKKKREKSPGSATITNHSPSQTSRGNIVKSITNI